MRAHMSSTLREHAEACVVVFHFVFLLLLAPWTPSKPLSISLLWMILIFLLLVKIILGRPKNSISALRLPVVRALTVTMVSQLVTMDKEEPVEEEEGYEDEVLEEALEALQVVEVVQVTAKVKETVPSSSTI